MGISYFWTKNPSFEMVAVSHVTPRAHVLLEYLWEASSLGTYTRTALPSLLLQMLERLQLVHLVQENQS